MRGPLRNADCLLHFHPLANFGFLMFSSFWILLAYLAAEYIECGSLDFNLFPIGTDKFKHDFQSHRHHTQSSARVGIRVRSLSSPE